MKKLNRTGPRTDPCGTPLVLPFQHDCEPLIATLWERFSIHLCIHLTVAPSWLYFPSLFMQSGCGPHWVPGVRAERGRWLTHNAKQLDCPGWDREDYGRALGHNAKRLGCLGRAGSIRGGRLPTVPCNPSPPQIESHEDDVNTVAFADGSSHILFSGGDDAICKAWDRRTMREDDPKPVGMLAGHQDGITFIDSKVRASWELDPALGEGVQGADPSLPPPAPGRRPLSDFQLEGPDHQAVGHPEVLGARGAGGVTPGRHPAELGLPLAAGAQESLAQDQAAGRQLRDDIPGPWGAAHPDPLPLLAPAPHWPAVHLQRLLHRQGGGVRPPEWADHQETDQSQGLRA
uniref:Uncharacterized protein n=1 Tax=Chelydra serpentina TaxID=8475 RepID=A0A8C3S734_CHESE